VLVATVIVPRPGTIEELSVTEGQLVEKGQALATLSTKGTTAELERLRTRAAALEKQLAQLAKTVKPAEVAKAREALSAKAKELVQATEQKRRLEVKHSPAAAIAHAEKEVRAKQALVDKATEQFAQVSQEEKLGTGRQVVEGLKRESAQLEAEVAGAHIVAPDAGRIEGLAAAGAVLAADAPFARLVSPARFTVVAHDPGVSSTPDLSGASVSTGAGAGASVSDLHLSDGQLSGTLSEPSLKPGPATLKIPLGKRAWGLELYERARAMIR
jgi:multidrug efflux pump subunit AcrA (membrane-fusion protein)